MKRLGTLLITFILILVLGTTAFAASGTWKKSSGKWWYQYEDGTYPSGTWSKIDGKWYHFDGKGYMQTGWLKDSGKWYYLGTNGAMKTGWQKVSSKWYYLGTNGVMTTGWQKVSKKWYYLGTDGAMKTGWQKISKKWYFLGTDGAMKTGWQKVSGKWYYLNTDGTMKTGWLKSGGKWYYLKSSGVMAANETVDGYYFDKNGVWVEEADTADDTENTGIFKGATATAVNSDGLKLSDIVLQEEVMQWEDGTKHRYCTISATWNNNTRYYADMICTFVGDDTYFISDAKIAEYKETYPAKWKEQMPEEARPKTINKYFGGSFPLSEDVEKADKVYVVFLEVDKNLNAIGHTIVTIDMP